MEWLTIFYAEFDEEWTVTEKCYKTKRYELRVVYWGNSARPVHSGWISLCVLPSSEIIMLLSWGRWVSGDRYFSGKGL